MNVPELHEVPNLTVQISAVSVFDQVSLATMVKAQAKDSVPGTGHPICAEGGKPKGSAISKIWCKAVRKYLLQFE